MVIERIQGSSTPIPAPGGTPSPSHLVGVGATTGVGGTVGVSVAAFRSGLTRTERVSYGAAGEQDAWSHAVRVGTLEPRDPEERARALAWSAVVQAWQPLKQAPSALRVAAWCAGPPYIGSLVARQLGVDERRVFHAGEHGCAGLFALQDAWQAVHEQQVDIAVVVGVGVGSDTAGLERGRAEERVLGGESSFGTVPGEAAAALVWVSDRVRQELGLTSLGRLLSAARAEEKTPFGGATPCVGQGLVEAVRGALVPLGQEPRVAHVLCDLNGERERTDEWGFALPRLNQYLQTPGTFITPISAFGDVGAASGVLLLALASSLRERAEGPAPRCLIWTSSRERERAAALFEAAGGEAHQATPAAIAPTWALELDGSVLGELVDEGAFRYEQRQFTYARLEVSAPDLARPALARIENALDKLVQGLVECGPRAWDRAEQALDKPKPGALYTALRVLCEARQVERASGLVQRYAAAVPAHAEAARLAIEHAQPSGEAIDGIVAAWFEGGPMLASLALALAAQSGRRVSLAALRAVSDALTDDAVDEAAVWLAALSRRRDPEARPCIMRWQLSPHERLRHRWAQAELALGGAAGRANVLARSEQDAAVILPAALAVGAARVRDFRELASALSGNDACLALGVLGDPLGVPTLLERLSDPKTAQAAAWGLEILLGAAPLGTRLEPDLDERAPPQAVPCVSRDVGAWRIVAEGVLARHPGSARLRAGNLASVKTTLSLLERLHLPLRVRGHLALELEVRWNVRQHVHVHALLRQQRSTLGAIELLPEPGRPGSWD